MGSTPSQMYPHAHVILLRTSSFLRRAREQNIVSFIGLFCKRDLSRKSSVVRRAREQNIVSFIGLFCKRDLSRKSSVVRPLLLLKWGWQARHIYREKRVVSNGCRSFSVKIFCCQDSFCLPLLLSPLGHSRHIVAMGWLRWVCSFKLKVSVAKEPYKRDYILQTPIILRSLMIVATPYSRHI